MAQLAIKGHPTRGKEVIEILEMLGGTNLKNFNGASNLYYLIGIIDPKILGAGKLELDKSYEQFTYFTLEEFLEKYPYKVGDKVCYQPNLQIDTICISEIISMKWADNSVIYFTSNGHSLYACDLQPYKEEIIEEGTNKAIFEGNAQSCDIMNDIIKEEAMEEKGTLVQIDLTRELRIADEVEVILGDYEFVLKDGKTYFVKKKPQYPKTYEECCDDKEWYTAKELLDYNDNTNKMIKDMEEKDKAKAPDLKGEDYSGRRFGYKIPNGYEFECVRKNEIILKPIKPQYPKTYEECCEVLMGKTDFQDFELVLTKISINRYEGNSISPEPPHISLINNFYKLLICRDAYWKIAGEQMGLGKPWKPDWADCKDKFCITIFKNKPIFDDSQYISRVLAFPTEEMRDEFYENFKYLIEQCKELL